MDLPQRPRRCIGLERMHRVRCEMWTSGQRTRDLETLLVIVLDGAVLYGFVEKIDKGEDELLFLHVCHRR